MTQNNDFNCPITMEPFKIPVFIPQCGHTFERNAVIKLKNKKCPVCNNAIIGDPKNFPINWVIASHLNLNIEKISNNKQEISSYNAIDAEKEVDLFIEENVNKIVNNLLIKVKEKSSQGFTYHNENNFYGNYSSVVSKHVIKKLQSKGFTCRKTKDSMRIEWKSNCVII